MNYNNLSDGTSDGFVMLYMKHGKLKPVALRKDEADLLDLVITTPFKKPVQVISNRNINVKNGVIQEASVE